MAMGIIGYGAYIPKYRIKREEIARGWDGFGKGERSVKGIDEDIVTMGVEASERALSMASLFGEKLDFLYLATDSAPYLEFLSSITVSEVLGLRSEADRMDFTNSPSSSMGAIKAMMDALECGRGKLGLVVASDSRPSSPGSNQEMNFGDGAAAFILGNYDTIADIEGHFSFTTKFVDRWRASQDDFVREYDDPRFIREKGYLNHVVEAAKGLLKKLGSTVEDYQYVILEQVDDRLPSAVMRSLGIKREQLQKTSTFNLIGDTGTSSILIGISLALDEAKPGDRILSISYAQGSSVAMSFKVKNEIERARKRVSSIKSELEKKEYIDYVRYARQVGLLKKVGEVIEMAVPPLSPAFWRGSREILQLIGIKCKECGFVNFPPSLRKICVRCGGREFQEVKISKKGKIHCYGVNYYMPLPFESPLPMIVGEHEDGVKYVALGTEMAPEKICIDLPVELVLRVIAMERGVTVYGYKYKCLN